MDLGLISVRYARALLKASTESGLSATVYEEMQALAANFAGLPELKSTIDNPMLSKSQKRSLLLAAVGPSPSALTTKFVDVVLESGREGSMQFIANSFITLYRKQNGLVRAKLVTASTPSQHVEERLKKLVESKSEGSVEFVTEIDPTIIGGFVLEYDTYRLDASVRTKLNTILSGLN